MDEMVCNKCNASKPLTEFDKQSRSGPRKPWNLRKRCKSCIHGEYLERRAKPERRAAQLQASRTWKQNNLDRHAELSREYRKRHPEKIIAQNRLNYAIKKGLIKRQPCEGCGTDQKVHAHHHNYDDWYNVKWLCYVCHKLEHS